MWAWTVLAVVVCGAVTTMFFIFYVMFKVSLDWNVAYIALV